MLCSTLNQGSVCTLQAQPPQGGAFRPHQTTLHTLHQRITAHEAVSTPRNTPWCPVTRTLGTLATSKCGSAAVRRLCRLLLRAAVNTRNTRRYCQATVCHEEPNLKVSITLSAPHCTPTSPGDGDGDPDCQSAASASCTTHMLHKAKRQALRARHNDAQHEHKAPQNALHQRTETTPCPTLLLAMPLAHLVPLPSLSSTMHGRRCAANKQRHTTDCRPHTNCAGNCTQ